MFSMMDYVAMGSKSTMLTEIVKDRSTMRLSRKATPYRKLERPKIPAYFPVTGIKGICIYGQVEN
ncbi:MAG: hypothetical protein CV082_13690 [Candidatus Brocadia sp. BL1]|nr:MAG: hypothetical protein CV082_13690 [Candidatus Brocadia sp. BL1]